MHLSKKSKRGIFWLLLLGLLISYTPRIIIAATTVEEKVIVTNEDLIQFEREVQLATEQGANKFEKKKSKFHTPPSSFDPNQYSKDDWMKLGLSAKQADVVIRFTQRGITSNEDLKKIFVISDEFYELIKDSTHYSARTKKVETEVAESTILVELNAASENELLAIPGIGPFYAKKIVEYRTSLGGFVSEKQLLEIWKFDEVKLEEIKPFIVINETELEKIDINTATIEELKSHPYISYSIANSIVKMRLHSGFENIDDVKRSKLIDEELFTKIKPYIRVK